VRHLSEPNAPSTNGYAVISLYTYLANGRFDKENGIIIEIFLRDKLNLPTQEYMDDRFLEGTRKSTMADVSEWLKNRDINTSNVLWISGAPGAGKTAISSIIARGFLGYRCARFIIKKEHAALMDPRAIWRSIAFQLAEQHQDFRRFLALLLTGEVGNSYPDNASIKDQFRQLICRRLREPAAFTPSETEFLDTIVEWSEKLPKTCKLIVTSRNEPVIEKALTNICHPVFLDSGDGVSEATNSEIRFFFETKFGAMDDRPDSLWPGPEAVEKLTQYASGNFGWANLVVNYMGYTYGDRVGRLDEVLSDMSKFPECHMSYMRVG